MNRQIEVARQIREEFRWTPGVVDVDWTVEDEQPRYTFQVDKEKAALHGVGADQISSTLRVALSGAAVGLAHLPKEREDVPIFLELPRKGRPASRTWEKSAWRRCPER